MVLNSEVTGVMGGYWVIICRVVSVMVDRLFMNNRHCLVNSMARFLVVNITDRLLAINYMARFFVNYRARSLVNYMAGFLVDYMAGFLVNYMARLLMAIDDLTLFMVYRLISMDIS